MSYTQYKEQIHQYVEAHKDEIVETLMALVRIPSIASEAEEGAPYGRACREALDAVRALHDAAGFTTEIDEEGGYLLSHTGESDKSIGLFGHADVVPVDENWIYTEPFSPIVKDGFVIGRGAFDDKSGVITSLYAMRAVKELGIPVSSRLTAFVGSNEETGMNDIRTYSEKHPLPTVAFIPDSEFPVYRGDKGAYRFFGDAKTPFTAILDVNGGEAFNVALGKVVARIVGDEALYNEISLLAKDDAKVSVARGNGEITVEAKGISRHAAMPEGSENAMMRLAALLSKCEALPESDRKLMETAAMFLQEYYGEVFGIENDDPEFGKVGIGRLTCVNGMVRTENGCLSLSFDCRYGPSADAAEMAKKISLVMEECGFTYREHENSTPYYVPEENPFLQKMLEVYSDYTGETNLKTGLNAGGTYGKYLPLPLEIGSQIPEKIPFPMPDGHGDVHQPDECISVRGLLRAVEVTALMVIAADEMMR